MYEEPRFKKFIGERISPWLEGNALAMVFFWCDWRAGCEQIKAVLEECYLRIIDPDCPQVSFVWVDADERGDLCKELSVFSFPTVLFFQEGKETARFICLTSREAIRHQVETLAGEEVPEDRILFPK